MRINIRAFNFTAHHTRIARSLETIIAVTLLSEG